MKIELLGGWLGGAMKVITAIITLSKSFLLSFPVNKLSWGFQSNLVTITALSHW